MPSIYPRQMEGSHVEITKLPKKPNYIMWARTCQDEFGSHNDPASLYLWERMIGFSPVRPPRL